MVNKKQSIAEARKLLSQFAPEGESLAFINEDEARLLKAHGGSGELTEAGIPTYFFKKIVKKVSKLTKKVKERYRKIMPNEVAAIGGKLAPIVSMFNPLVGAAMAAQSSLDRDGSITDALKTGAKSYVMGQAGRAIGGGMGNLQGNPFATGANPFSFSSPMGTGEGGLGSFFKNIGGDGGSLTDLFRQTVTPGNELSTLDQIAQANAGGGGIGNLFSQGFNYLKSNPKLTQALVEGGINYFGQKQQNEDNDRYQGPGYDALNSNMYNRQYNDTLAAANGGRVGYMNGGPIRTNYNMGGMGSIPQTPMVPQGMQLNGQGGGFIPMGAQEKRDDVPAMLAKNEFVMTSDAVRAAGGGSIEKGAQRMYDMMNQLESQS